MQLFVKGLETSVLDVEETDRVIDVKEKLSNSEGIPCEDQVLTFAGRPLDNEETLASYGIASLSTISVDVRMLGGKVHGSLARAGKVKGQTPKVEAQEKKKKKTGRARRRMQYNKRFVNVVASFGRRRGPNSNAQ
ncbi:ubiquitin-like FUBI-ribosomal protein eS30 fusion protein [Watersipora subatra]|uniref:ubiquitin-like FUBI-ribosomal protein eS30 fusion protein n=1 Tax=Watersipora subatra TaxID=2589382 RepID=UPI00355BD7E5